MNPFLSGSYYLYPFPSSASISFHNAVQFDLPQRGRK
jgi:hypothetical protein